MLHLVYCAQDIFQIKYQLWKNHYMYNIWGSWLLSFKVYFMSPLWGVQKLSWSYWNILHWNNKNMYKSCSNIKCKDSTQTWNRFRFLINTRLCFLLLLVILIKITLDRQFRLGHNVSKIKKKEREDTILIIMSDSLKTNHNTFYGHNPETQLKESDVVMVLTNVTILCEKLKNDLLFSQNVHTLLQELYEILIIIRNKF